MYFFFFFSFEEGEEWKGGICDRDAERCAYKGCRRRIIPGMRSYVDDGAD